MTIHDVPGTINRCLNFAATSTNFKAGFLVTVIFPYNRSVFPDVEFLSFDLTDRQTDRPASATDAAALSGSNGRNNLDLYEEPGPSGINCPEPGPSKRTPAEENPSSSMSFTLSFSVHFLKLQAGK